MTTVNTRRQILIKLILVLSVLNPLVAYAEWYKQKAAIMGTEITVEIWHEDKAVAQHCIDDVFNEMSRIDVLMSPYKNNSELSQLNDQASERYVEVSNELFSLIKKSIEFSELSSGAFDITFSSVGYLYDYRKSLKPTDDEIMKNLDAVNYRHIVLDENKLAIRFKKPGVRIDLGGIAKGYAVDNGIEILKRCGTQYGLVTAGGDSRILGDKKGRPWVMGVQHPRKKGEVAVVLPLSNTALSTSGDYERFFIENGERIHHIINPETGKSVKHAWSASVIAKNALTSDALSTTLFILGEKKGMALINQLDGVDALIIDAGGNMHYSSGLISPEKELMN